MTAQLDAGASFPLTTPLSAVRCSALTPGEDIDVLTRRADVEPPMENLREPAPCPDEEPPTYPEEEPEPGRDDEYMENRAATVPTLPRLPLRLAVTAVPGRGGSMDAAGPNGTTTDDEGCC